MSNNDFPICIVDAFTNEPYKGNPAAVCVILKEENVKCFFDDCIDDEEAIASKMQTIASEMNLSETAFVTPSKERVQEILEGKEGIGEEEKKFHLRWFTPTVEVPLCGHATLAASKVLVEYFENELKGDKNSDSVLKIHYTTEMVGSLFIDYDKKEKKFAMNFPLGDPKPFEFYDSKIEKDQLFIKRLMQYIFNDCFALNIENPMDVIVDVKLCSKNRKLIIRVNDLNLIKNINANNVSALTDICDMNEFAPFLKENYEKVLKGVCFTYKTQADNDKYDFVSRYFAPWLGIPEDPVTGSLHTVLGAYYYEYVFNKEKDQFKARQDSKRGGDLDVLVHYPEKNRVTLKGEACVVLNGTIKV